MISALAGASATVIAMIALAPAASATAAPGTEANPYVQHEGIPICHRTNSDTNPYVANSPDFNSIVKNGHDSHDGAVWSAGMKADHDKWGDIIPPFWYQGKKDAVPTYYAGKNWDTTGQDIYGKGCVVSTDNGGGSSSTSESSSTSDQTTVTVVKQWVINDGAPVPDNTEDGRIPGSLTVDKVGDANWGQPFSWNNEVWPQVSEGDDAEINDEACSVDDEYGIDHPTYLISGENNVITITNYVTCQNERRVFLYKIWKGATGEPSTTLTISHGDKSALGASTWNSELGSDPDWAGGASLIFFGDSFTISETAVSGYSSSWECYLTPPAPSLRSPAVGAFATTIDYSKPIATGSGTSGTIADSEGDVTCYFTNTKDEGGGGGGTSTPTETPEETTTTTLEVSAEASEEPVNVIAPAPEVKGESNVEQVPAVAPSANAHTGQSQSGWAYGLLGAGILLLLTSVRVRRSRRL